MKSKVNCSIATDKHFHCTACGKCCYGVLPLTSSDAFAHSSRFPLAFNWTPIRPENKNYSMALEIGIPISIPGMKKDLAVIITPIAYIPPEYPCPALGNDNLCTIQDTKPLRCKTMPFYPYQEERFQAENLVPRSGWECDISTEAPIVYKNSQIVYRSDFDNERAELLQQLSQLKQYVDYMLKYSPMVINSLVQLSMNPRSGSVITSLSSFLTATRNGDAKLIAEHQIKVLSEYVGKTANNPKLAVFHKNYSNWLKEMKIIAERR